MRCGPFIIALVLSAGVASPAKAQQQLFKNYSVNDGLVANPVRRIFQDKKGFLWIGTWEGLSKYDGHNFTNFTTEKGLSHDMVNDIYESATGHLFVVFNNGSIDIISGKNQVIRTDSSGIVINTIEATPWHKLIAITDNNGLQEFQNGKLIKPVQPFPSETFTEIKIISDSSFITTGSNYIKVFNKNYDLITQTKMGFDHHSDIKVFQDSKKRLWAGSSTGLKLLTTPQKYRPLNFLPVPAPFNTPLLTNIKINDIFEDTDGTIWFATTSGIVKIDSDGTTRLISVKDGLSSNIVNTIFQDKEKNVWFGTEVGLSKLVTTAGIRLFPIENGVASSDNSFLLHPLSKNNFLVSTAKGVTIFNKLTGAFTPINNRSYSSIYYVIPNVHPTQFLDLNRLVTLDTSKLKFNKSSPRLLNSASRLLIDEAGNHFSNDLDHLFVGTAKSAHTILPYRIAAMLIDKHGDLWAGTWNNGLYRIKYQVADTGISILATENMLPGENIRSVYNDHDDNIWVGTRYNGLFQLTRSGKDNFTIKHISKQHGLTSNFIKAVREDADHNFWIASYNGIDKLIRLNNGFRIFNFSRFNNYYTRIIGMETDADNILWLATNEGIVKIKDVKMEEWPAPPIYITHISTPDSTYTAGLKNIVLNYRQNQVQIAYAAPGYVNEKQTLYSYRLSTTEPAEWSAATHTNTVSYASLQPGNYRFEVRTLGWNAVWGEPAVFNFTVNPPFWQTWWFVSLTIFVILLLIYLFIKWRIKNIQTINTEKLKVQRLNAAQLKNQLEQEQIINYFSSSLVDKNKTNEVLWDVAKNLIGRLGFVDCMIYLWHEDNTKMKQVAGFGPKESAEEINKKDLYVKPGHGIVGLVMQSKEPIIIPDTAKDNRYTADEMNRQSEITVPIIYNNELIGIIDSKHPDKNFYNAGHLQILTTIATLMADKIKAIEAEQALQQKAIEMYGMKEQLTKAKLEALQSQMNPHFIFNCLNSIDNLIQMDEKEKATAYLSKFARLLRYILENAASNTVPCWKDMETLKLYLELESLRFSHRFSYDIAVPDQVLNGDYKVPPLVIQPFVENAIHHGLLCKKGVDKRLTVDVTLEGNYIRYMIKDNGIGRQKAAAYKALNKPAYASMGIRLTADRINLFNQQSNGAVKITDLQDAGGNATGTCVEVNLLNQS